MSKPEQVEVTIKSMSDSSLALVIALTLIVQCMNLDQINTAIEQNTKAIESLHDSKTQEIK